MPPAWLPYRDAAILELFIYSCGMRLSELVGLDVSSVDHRFRGVRVMGKGAQGSAFCLWALLRWRLWRPMPPWPACLRIPCLSPA